MSAEIIQDMLRKNLGIEMTIKQVPFKQRLELMNKSDYDVVFAGWGPDYDDPMTYLDLWVTGGGHNNTGWSNKEYDELIKFAKTTGDFKSALMPCLKQKNCSLKRANCTCLLQAKGLDKKIM